MTFIFCKLQSFLLLGGVADHFSLSLSLSFNLYSLFFSVLFPFLLPFFLSFIPPSSLFSTLSSSFCLSCCHYLFFNVRRGGFFLCLLPALSKVFCCAIGHGKEMGILFFFPLNIKLTYMYGVLVCELLTDRARELAREFFFNADFPPLPSPPPFYFCMFGLTCMTVYFILVNSPRPFSTSFNKHLMFKT